MRDWSALPRVAWPDAFGTRFALFVDTEEEFDWSAPLDRSQRSVRTVAALPSAHARFAGRGVPVTYLVDHPVATDPDAAATIRPLLADGVSAVGAQLHPWVNPPFGAGETSFAGALPIAAEAAKLDALTAAITTSFGAPRAYRAGRYGIGPATAGLLAARGYRLDSSMRARFDYSREGGPNFGAVDPHARYLGGLVELPLTTVYTGALRGAASGLHRAARRLPRGRGLLARGGLLSRVPLTPEGVSAAEALAAIDVALAEGVRVLNFSFHSPSLVPGNTPYVRDEADLSRFWRWWDVVLDRLDARGVRPVSLDALLDAAAVTG